METLLKKEPKSLRKAYGETLAQLGSENKNIVVLDADLSASTQTSIFAKVYPERFFDCGIAEQDMMAMAAGFASQGKIPFVSTFAMFATGRTYDQIRNSICYPNFNVKIVATHGGLTVGEDGASHQALEDISLMRGLPNMTVIVPSDSVEVKSAIRYAANHDGPFYIRIPRINLADIFDKGLYKFSLEPCEIVKGNDLTIISNGDVLNEVLTAEEILKKEGFSIQVISCPVLKPTPKTLLNLISSDKVVTVEDHSIIGALGSMTAEIISESSRNIQLLRLGTEDKFGQSGKSDELLDFYGLSASKIVQRVKIFV